MAKVAWDTSAERFYEVGLDRGVLYTTDSPGVPWNGLISVDENPDGGDVRSLYQDGLIYRQVPVFEEYRATISAYQRPAQFGPCEGRYAGLSGMVIPQQRRKPFGMSYRTFVGNSLGNQQNYQIHILYNMLAKPSQRIYRSLDGSGNAMILAWDVSGTPATVPGYRKTPHLVVDSSLVTPELLAALEDILYGTDVDDPRLPTPSEIFELGFGFIVIDNEDGTYTVTAPDSVLTILDPDSFQVDSDQAVVIDANSFTLTSI